MANLPANNAQAPLNQLTDTLSAPIGELIAAIGSGVAEAQQAMDAATIANVRALAQAGDAEGTLALLRQIGYQPTWYQIPEVSAEINVALTVSGSGGAGGGIRLLAAPVDASYSNRYNYELKAASTVRFRIVPVPPSPKAERMRAVPQLVGLSFQDAKARLGDMDIGWQLPQGSATPKDEAPVKEQSPAPGSLLTGGETVEIRF